MWEAGFGAATRRDAHRPASERAAAQRPLPGGDRPAHATCRSRRRSGCSASRRSRTPANARQQAARGTFDPAYLNYTLGKLMVRKLREDWTASRGGRAAWREFHDRFLSYGGPPIPLVREAMLGQAAGPAL